MQTFPKTATFPQDVIRAKIMGPNPLKILEELLATAPGGAPKAGSVTLDLGSGSGLTSAMLARAYGLRTYAVDLWSDPAEVARFLATLGLSREQVTPVRADAASGLPFPYAFFDAVVSVDAYNYFGRDPAYLGECLLPYVRRGGRALIAVPGMVRDCHDALPACLTASWTPEQLEYMHDARWWRSLISRTPGVDILDVREMSCTREAWDDWLACDNDYARGDRASVEAGALAYLNTLAITLRKA